MNYFYRFCRFLIRIYLRLFCRLDLKNSHKVPRSGGLIIASNHISAGDPPLLGSACPREVYFMAKKELFKPPLGILIKNLNAFPVDRNKFDLQTIRKSLELLNAENALLMFPEGTRSRDGRLGRPKSGIGMLAVKAKVPIVPVYIANTKNAWQNLFVGKKLVVHFGEPISVDDLTIEGSKADYMKISLEVMHRIEMLKRADETRQIGFGECSKNPDSDRYKN